MEKKTKHCRACGRSYNIENFVEEGGVEYHIIGNQKHNYFSFLAQPPIIVAAICDADIREEEYDRD